MPSSITIHTTPSTTQAVIIGNKSNLGIHTSKLLIDKGVEVNFFSSERQITDHQSFSLLKASKLFHHHSKDTPKSISQHSTYTIFFLDHNSKFEKPLSNILQKAAKSNSKFTLVTSNFPVPKDPQTLSDQTDQESSKLIQHAQALTSMSSKKDHLNARVVHLNHLFGPGVEVSDQSQLGVLFSQMEKQQYLITGNDRQTVFPLFTKDAAQGILKAIFVSHSKGKIYELGGDSISLINFSYKIRTRAEKLGFTPSSQSAQIPITDKDLESQLMTTRHNLRWHPQISLEQGIEATIDWYQSSYSSHEPAPTTSPLPQLENLEKSLNLPTISMPAIKLKKQPVHLEPAESTKEPPAPTRQKTSRLSPKIFSPFKKKLTTPSIKPVKFKTQIFIFGLALFLIASLPFSFLAYNIYQSARLFGVTTKLLRTADFKQANLSAIKTSQSLDSLQTKISTFYPTISIVFGQDSTQNISDLLSIAQTTNSSIANSTEAVLSANDLIELITGKQTGNLTESVQTIKAQTARAYHDLSTIQAKLDNSDHLFALTSFGVGDRLKEVYDFLPEYRDYLGRSQQILAITPELLGDTGKKTYLVLLQNNAELRPTGGFIGSFALITFEKGTLLDIKVEDVYAADGQLKGHVEPPEEIKKYLGEAGWFLRDSNWDPNFPTSADRAAWFLEKELGTKVDGVIAINLHTIQKLLEITGPVTIPDYDETIDSKNLFDRVEYQVEINQFPGSTQKRDFIGKLTNTIIDQTLNGPQEVWYKNLLALFQSADQNQLLLSVNDQESNQVFSDLGWTGEILGSGCPDLITSKSCLSDYLGIFEANVGVNKANYFINRQISHQTDISQSGRINSTLTLSLQNTSPGETWPGGVYKNYLRVFTPPNSKLLSLRVNNDLVNKSEIDQTNQHNKTAFGFLVQTPPGKSSQITLEYQLAKRLGSGSLAAYSLTVQKQSGTPSDPLEFTISYPESLKPIVTTPQARLENQRLIYTQPLSQNRTYSVEFAR